MKKALLVVLLLVAPLGVDAADIHSLSSVQAGGVTITDGQTVSASSIQALSNFWAFNFTWPNGVFNFPVVAVFRGTFGNLEGGTLQSGVNYSLNAQSWGAGNNSIAKFMDVAPLGTQGLQSGDYTAVVAELANSGNPYGGFADWFQSGGSVGVAPINYSTITFHYDASVHATELPGALHTVQVGGRTINQGDQVFKKELQALNGSTDNYWIFNFDWPNQVQNQQAALLVFRGTFGNIEGVTPVSGINYYAQVQAWASGNNEFGKFMYLPPLKDISTAPGIYTVMVAERSPLDQGDTTPLAQWFATGATQGAAPLKYSLLTFELKDNPKFKDCCSNVLFLPGIESSRLYRPDYNGGTDRLWEPGENNDVRDLYMRQDGSSTRDDVYTKVGDVLDETPIGTNVYKSFLQKMDGMKTEGKINDWEPIAYDWRLSLDDILTNGNNINGRLYYSGSLAPTSTPYVIQELKHLAATSQTGKVTIVAHSNGGLLAKRLTEVLGSEASQLVDKIVLVAVPQAGTPMALGAGMHGYRQQYGFGWVLSSNVARTFASTSPMFYNLLPSTNYFTQVDDPVVTFDANLTDWISKYGATIHSQDLLDNFLTDTYGRVSSETGDTDQPIKFDQSLLSNANSLHANLDNWVPPSGIAVTQIAGWGVPSTVSGITYTKKGSGVKPNPNFTVDGDGTVVVPSALWTSQSTATNYWINLERYNKNNSGFSSGFGLSPFEHSRILETTPVKDFISDLLGGVTKQLTDYTYITSVPPASSGARLRYSLHSPLTLNLYDDLGRHTGISTTTGQLEEQIPGTYYTEYGDAKYIFADAGAPGHIVMNGYDTGTFTLGVDQLQGDTQTASVVFTDLPTTPQTNVQIDIQSDVSTLSTMRIDQNSDGNVDTYVAPDGAVLSIDQLMVNLTTAVQNLTATAKVKTQLLNKITAIQKKIDKQRQKQSDVLAKLKAQIQKKADKGKIDSAVATDIGNLLDSLISQSATIPLDPALIGLLQSQINSLTVAQSLKNSLLARVAQLQNLAGVTKSLASMTQAVTKKGVKGQISDAEVQSVLNLLDQIQNAL